MPAIAKISKTNADLTRRVTELHLLGYDHDFILSAGGWILCLQSSTFYLKQAASVTLVDQVYDSFYGQFRYIYAVEPDTGEKGILVLSHIAFDVICELD